MSLSPLNALTIDSTVIAAIPEQVSSELSGEAVVLDLKAGVYYGLNPVGARIWQLIQQPSTIASLRDTLLQEYEVDPEVCTQELLTLLQELAAAGLVEVCHAQVA